MEMAKAKKSKKKKQADAVENQGANATIAAPVEKPAASQPIQHDQEQEILRLSEQIEKIMLRVRSAEREVGFAAEAAKNAKKLLESRQEELQSLCDQMVQVRNGTWQPPLPMGASVEKPAKGTSDAGAVEIPEDLYSDAIGFIASRREKKQGFTAGSLALKIYGSKKKELVEKAEIIIGKLVAEGHVLPSEDGGKDYWSADPKDIAARAKEAAATGSGA